MHSSISAFDALEFSAVATFVIDPHHAVLLWNKACEELTGVKRDQILGKDLHWQAFYQHKRPCLADLVISGRLNEAADFYPTCGRSPLSPEGIQAEGWFERVGGKKRYMRFEAVPIYNPEGLLLGAIETLLDLTDDRLRQEEDPRQLLREAENALTSAAGLTAYLPICCSCQHLRDPDGSWLPPADYFHKHLGLDFSHTICPGCSRKLYPQFFASDADDGTR
ncbi:MAG: PAS domain-containing protein [Thermodesulfobacteriota bacterium]